MKKLFILMFVGAFALLLQVETGAAALPGTMLAKSAKKHPKRTKARAHAKKAKQNSKKPAAEEPAATIPAPDAPTEPTGM